MKANKIIYIIIALLCVNFAWDKLKPEERVIDYGEYQRDKETFLDSLKTLNVNLKQNDHEINRIKKAMVQSDSIIDSSSSAELNVLFADFFDKIR